MDLVENTPLNLENEEQASLSMTLAVPFTAQVIVISASFGRY